MDDFGVLVESIGFKAHGKSAPMAKLKPKPQSQYTPNYTSSFADSSSLPVDELDGIFRSSVNRNKTNKSDNFFGHDDVFGGSSNQVGGIDFESILSNSNSNSRKNAINLNSVGSSGFDDLLGLNTKQSHPVNDDVLGSFVQNSSAKQEKKVSTFDDLIPGFEEASFSSKGGNSKTDFFSESIGQPLHSRSNVDLFPESNGQPSHSRSTVQDDPFLVFESNASQPDASWPFAGSSEQNKRKDSVQVLLDDFDNFVMGMGHKDSRTDTTTNTNNKPNGDTFSNGFQTVDDLDAIFKDSTQKKHGSRPPSTTQDSQFDIFFPQEKGPEMKQTSVAKSTGNDFSSIFGDLGPSSGEFEEIDGEPDERRRARLSRHLRTNARVAEALAVKNQRDLQTQHEQEEKHRLAETLDSDIKRWAAGKENNLRALLSSLQQVLWPGCGWRAVSLTDMITSDSVKKVYKKATLYVHPDKVQQKGANLEQKYIAEKVFDLLKEAWNKFSAEELR